MAVLPHYSPGYPEWAIDEQRGLPHFTTGRASRCRPSCWKGPGLGHAASEEVAAGRLRPDEAHGSRAAPDRARRLRELLVSDGAQDRRSPYRRAPQSTNPELVAIGAARAPDSRAESPCPRSTDTPTTRSTPKRSSAGATSACRWSADSDGTVDAVFRYEGTTCTNMGRPLRFQYRVTLGPPEEGFPIREQGCAPSDGDEGHTYMCR